MCSRAQSQIRRYAGANGQFHKFAPLPPAREHENPLKTLLAGPQGCFFSSIYIKFAVLNNVPYASFKSQLGLFLYRCNL